MTIDLIYNEKKLARVLLIIFVLSWGECFGKEQLSNNTLVKVGNKEITVTEFLSRCEFTVRPGNFQEKTTALNNLIIEKILALEAEKKNLLESNPGFQARLKGIKEQAMREKLYDIVAYKKATVDTNKLKNAYRLSQREYELEFYRMHKDLAQKVKAYIDTASGRIDDMFLSLTEYVGKQPVHKVNYKDQDNDIIHEALYSKQLEMGQVIGPIQFDADDYLVMKVLNWTSYPLISEVDQQIRWEEVRKRELSIVASKIWESYLAGIMKGKEIDFDTGTFLMLANWVREKYIAEQKKKEPSVNQIAEIPFNASGLDLTSPFFKFEDKVWTVGDFRKELMSRPFLFKSINLDSANFNSQFEMAVADIMRDHCLTREAYKKSLDASVDIKRSIEVWKDSFLAKNQQKEVVDNALKEGKIIKNDDLGISKYWESYVNDLQKKYYNSVKVNVPAFKNIQLPRIDMVALKLGMPYPTLVPDFPIYLSPDTINYMMHKE